MIFPWSQKKKQEDERSLASAKASLEKLKAERKAAAAKVERTLEKLLEIKEAKHGSS
jgi:hypothetical protein